MKGENRACGLKDKKQKSNYLKKIGVFAWTAGSLVLTVAASIYMPKIIDWGAEKIGRINDSVNGKPDLEKELGFDPEIVKKQVNREEKE